MERILVIDDDKDLRFNLSSILKDEGYDVLAVDDGREALKAVQRNCPNLVLLDICLPGINGMEILEKFKKIDKDLIIIMLTAYAEVKNAVQAMRLGAFDYVTKPFDNEELILNIKKALQTQYLSREVQILRKRLGESSAIEEVMGESPRIKQVLKQIELIAPTDMTVVIQGASGTGKELIARMLHEKSLRKDKSFIAIDCGAIPDTLVESELFGYEKGAFTGAEERKEGKFEQAHCGTLFFDEVTNLHSSIQTKLLRAVQERKFQHLGGRKDISVDVRIIVATNINLSEAVKIGRFRDDLFHRLNEFHIDLPSLRERKEDLPFLTKYFLEEANRELGKKTGGFSGEVMKFFLDYAWPGNVRELKNLTRRAVLLAESDIIEFGDLSLNQTMPASEIIPMKPLDKPRSLYFEEIFRSKEGRDERISFGEITREFEKDLLRKVLDKASGNKLKAAKILKIDRKTLYRKMKSSGL